MKRKEIWAKLGLPSGFTTAPQTTTSAERSALVAGWNADQKRYAKESFRGSYGRFSNWSELYSFLVRELIKDDRSRAAIARDAGISPRTLSYFIRAGKISVSPLERKKPEIAIEFSGGPRRHADREL